MRRNRWIGRKLSAWIEAKIIETKGLDWWKEHQPCNFEYLRQKAQELQFKCGNYEYYFVNRLREKGLPVDHQVIFLNRFIVDASLMKARLIIELDGVNHFFIKENDAVRDELFRLFGFTVLRIDFPFRNKIIDRKVDSILKAYSKYNVGKPIEKLVRPSRPEIMFDDGLIQKELRLPKRLK